MIKFEDEEFEAFFFSDAPDIAIPIEMFEDTDGKLTITTYRATEAIAVAFEERYASCPFSSEALRYLDEQLRPIVASWGYKVDNRKGRHILNFVADSADQIDRSVILPESHIIDTLPEELDNGTTHYFGRDEEECAVIVQDGCVVAVACVNPFGENADERELNVETAPKYRRRGYSTSNAATLALKLLEDGYRVVYKCSSHNDASRRVAEKCGFSFVGRSYYYVCYINE